MDLDIAAAAMRVGARNAELVWQVVLREFGHSTAPGQMPSCELMYTFLQHSKGPLVAFVFDQCDALLELPAAFAAWTRVVRALSEVNFPDSR